MQFKRGQEPKKAMGLGAIKMFWVSMGAGAQMKEEAVEAMLRHWVNTKTAPGGVYPLVERSDGAQHFVETIDLAGKFIEYNGKYYQIPKTIRV